MSILAIASSISRRDAFPTGMNVGISGTGLPSAQDVLRVWSSASTVSGIHAPLARAHSYVRH